MDATYQIAELTTDRVDQAYPLIGAVAPALDLAAWRAFCRSIIDRGDSRPDLDNVIVAMSPLGYIQGLCITTVREHAEGDRILDAPIFVVASAADSAGVAAELLDYLKAFGRAESCGCMRIWTLAHDNWTRRLSEGEIRRWDHGVTIILEPDARPPADADALPAMFSWI
ncbi:MAG: hypothetical protein WDN46_17255 [Methylocella sp.]